jgi:S1-C subfamily serine protease
MKPLLHAFEQAGYPIRQVDASREPQLAEQYNVTRFPTFIMLVGGREFMREIGKLDSQQLQRMFQAAKEEYVRNQPQPGLTPVKPAPTLTADERPAPPNVASAAPRGAPTGANGDTAGGTQDSVSPLLNATVRLRVEDSRGRSFGTGTIIDAREGEALVITCGHLFRESQGKDPVHVEMFEATPQGARPVGEVTGWVLRYDLEREIALVVMKPTRPVQVAPIAPAGSNIQRGDRVVSIGCSNGADPTVMATRITQLDRYQGPPNIEASGAPVEGRSGGGLFNDKGQLIGVCYAADYEGNEGLYAALESIHDEVGRLNLNSGSNQLAAAGGSSDGPVARGQDDPLPEKTPNDERQLITPLGTAAGPVQGPTAVPEGLDDAEAATWEHVVPRAVDCEVVIIVRPAGGESEMFTLDGASPAFVRAMAELKRKDKQTVTR